MKCVRSSQIVREYDQLSIFSFLQKQYGDQRRLSGECVYMHSIRIMKEMVSAGVDCDQLLLGALLHDVLEDTSISYTAFKSLFGEEIFFLVYGLSNLDQSRQKMKKSDYFFRFARDVQIDWRIMFIKLFDCIDNLRTLSFLPIENQLRFKKEKQ